MWSQEGGTPMKKILSAGAVIILGAGLGLAQGTSQNNGRTSRGNTGHAAGNPNNSAVAPMDSSRSGATAGDSSTGNASDAKSTTDPSNRANPSSTTTPGSATDASSSPYTRNGEEPREGHNWGWIGLLGLGGLAGLAKRRESEHTHSHRMESRGAASA